MTKPLNRFERKIRSLQQKLPDELRMVDYKNKYKKPTLAERAKMMREQDGYCAICFEVLPDIKKQNHIDHCHNTQMIRGLLCVNCNVGIGMFKDDPTVLRNAADYIESWCEKHAKAKWERDRLK